MKSLKLPIRHIIAIASTKGGVGKSTVALQLSLALKTVSKKLSIGLLDADIYGPSQPLMLGIENKTHISKENKFIPFQCFGLQVISIGGLMKETPIMWRGPMISKALQQLIFQTAWEHIDYLIVDLPPGTGDIPLTLIQKVPLTAAIIVTTPQKVATQEAEKSIVMFEKLQIPILGVIENMSGYQCTHCGHHEAIFDQGGGDDLAGKYHTKLLAKIPLEKNIAMQNHQAPFLIAKPDHTISQIYQAVAREVIDSVS